MTEKVKVLIEVEFEADNEGAVIAAVTRIPNDLKTSLEQPRVAGVSTGVKNSKIKIVKKS
jgi:hypothetical protein